jgi:flagellar biosynthetic protein FlhB
VKRFPPSARRLEEARRRGDVAVSPALLGAAALAGGAGVLVVAAPASWQRLLLFARRAFTLDAAPAELLADGERALAAVLAPFAVGAVAAALVAGLVQTRGLVTLAPLAPRAPQRRAVDGALRALLLAIAAAAATAAAFGLEADVARRLLHGTASLADALPALGRAVVRVAVMMIGAGVVDWLVRAAAARRALWMTRDEVERERREDEGDPRTAAERRRRAREGGGPRLVEQVASATVVVVSEGAAAGLGGDPARPIIAVSGERLVAARIVDLARRLGTPVRGDDELAPGLAPLASGYAVPPPLRARAGALLEATQR